MYAILRISEDGTILAANGAASELLGPCLGGRCCDAVLARTDQRRLVCTPTCGGEVAGSEGEGTDQRVIVRGRLCRLVCSRLGDEGVVVLEAGPEALAETRLTARERAALSLVADGLSTEEIAEALGVSASTARTHVERAREKLSARSRAAAVALALRRGEI